MRGPDSEYAKKNDDIGAFFLYIHVVNTHIHMGAVETTFNDAKGAVEDTVNDAIYAVKQVEDMGRQIAGIADKLNEFGDSVADFQNKKRAEVIKDQVDALNPKLKEVNIKIRESAHAVLQLEYRQYFAAYDAALRRANSFTLRADEIETMKRYVSDYKATQQKIPDLTGTIDDQPMLKTEKNRLALDLYFKDPYCASVPTSGSHPNCEAIAISTLKTLRAL